MLRYLFLLIVFFCFSNGAIFYVREDENDDEPVNFKFSKYLDVRVDKKLNSWKNYLTKYVQSPIDESEIEQKSKPVEIETNNNLDNKNGNVQSNNEKRFLNLLKMFEGCESLVGLSKLPVCNLYKNLDDINAKKIYPRSCKEILNKGNNKSGIYKIQSRTTDKPITVLCDMETKGGGWTHIQKRFDGSEDFYKNWRDYKFGFGDLNGEFWIGLENIYRLTGFETSELLIELTDRDKQKAYAQYASFAIGAEKDGYPLNTLKGFTGDAGDALVGHLSAKFTTKDVDQDANAGNCAVMFEGAWWYASCHSSNLNGKFINIALPKTYEYHGLNWKGFKGQEYNLAGSRMMVRPIDN